MPRSRAASTPTSQTDVLPIPVSPEEERARTAFVEKHLDCSQLRLTSGQRLRPHSSHRQGYALPLKVSRAARREQRHPTRLRRVRRSRCSGDDGFLRFPSFDLRPIATGCNHWAPERLRCPRPVSMKLRCRAETADRRRELELAEVPSSAPTTK